MRKLSMSNSVAQHRAQRLRQSFQKYHARTFQSGTHLHQLPQDSAAPLTEVSSTSKNPSLPLRVKRVPEEDDATVTPQKSNTDVVPPAVTTSQSSTSSSSHTLPPCLCARGECRLHCSYCYREAQTKCVYESDPCIAQQKKSQCHACDTPGCWTTNPHCTFYKRPRLPVPDARTDGRPAPDIFTRSVVRITRDDNRTVVRVGNREFVKGSASGLTYGLNNCLIHTLQQALNLTIGQVVADIPWVRNQLMKQFPRCGRSAVTRDNYLDLTEHWEAIIDLISQSAQLNGCDPVRKFSHTSFQIIAIDERTRTVGTCEGDGPTKIYILNEGRRHFVPLIKKLL